MLGVPCRRLITYQVPDTGYNTSEWTKNKEFTAAEIRDLGFSRSTTRPTRLIRRNAKSRGASRVRSGGVRHLMGRVRSGQECFKSHGSGRFTLTRPTRERCASGDLAREKARKIHRETRASRSRTGLRLL